MIAGYEHFAALARRLQWDEAAIGLRADAAAWPALAPELRARLATLLAGFCVGEAGVAEELAPFGAAAADPLATRCFELQTGDERRHARFFGRVAREVAGVPPTALRARLPVAFLELFDVRLPSVAGRLAAGETGLAHAVGLYHMVLEGVVFTAGQLAMLELLDDDLPGVREGVELVLRDERWHIGFGTRCLQDADASPAVLEAILREGADAALAWADAVGPDHTETVVAILRRRLGAIRRHETLH